MHELGIITHVAKTVDEIAESNHVTKVNYVTLEIGEVSGVITSEMISCWNYFKKKHPLLVNSELRIETVEAVTYCSGCGKNYETVRYGKICPNCGSSETWLVEGSELNIKEIGVDEAQTE